MSQVARGSGDRDFEIVRQIDVVRSAHERTRLAHCRRDGKDLVHIVAVTDAVVQGEFRSTTSGVLFDLQQLSAIIEALQSVKRGGRRAQRKRAPAVPTREAEEEVPWWIK